MGKWFKRIEQFLRAEEGPTAVEYAVMLALIIVACVVAIATLGTNTNSVFADDTLNKAAGASSST